MAPSGRVGGRVGGWVVKVGGAITRLLHRAYFVTGSRRIIVGVGVGVVGVVGRRRRRRRRWRRP